MKINQNYDLKTPNFRAVSLVQIPKKAFKNPENYAECSKIFSKAAEKVVGDKFGGKLAAIVAFFTTKPHKIATMLESLSYANSKIVLDKYMPNCSISWLAQNTGLPIKDALNENSHTFYVLTKEHKDGFMSCVKNPLKKLVSLVREGAYKYPSDPIMRKVYAQAKLGVVMEEKFTKMVGDTPIKNFKINNLDELERIAKEFEA